MPGGVVANRAAGALPIQRKRRNVDLALRQLHLHSANVLVEVSVRCTEVRHVPAALRHLLVEVLNPPAEPDHLATGLPNLPADPSNLVADP